MRGCRVYSFLKCFSHNQSSSRGFVIPFSTSSSNHLDQKWRRERKLPLNPNTSRDLRDAPDYSFLDGRPVPIGSRMKSRLEKQKKVAEKIVTLSREMDFAVERYKALQEANEAARQRKLDSKLKPKGHRMLQEK